MQKSDFFYDLPQELIAQTPIYPRDHSRLLHYDKQKDVLEDKHFFDIKSMLKKGAALTGFVFIKKDLIKLCPKSTFFKGEMETIS